MSGNCISENFINELPPHINEEWEEYNKFEKKAGNFGVAGVLKKRNGVINDKDKIHFVDLCIIKTILKSEFRQIESSILDILSNDIHSMKYYGSAKDGTHIYIYMEYCENAISLEDLLLRGSLNEAQIFKLIEMISLALKNLHSNNVIHRDIKDEHIFFLLKQGFNKNDGGTIEIIIDNILCVKFIDFGVSKLVTEKDGSKYYSYTGTDAYIAPEVKLRNKTAGRKADVYSLGCVLIKMAGGTLDSKGGTPNLPTHISNKLKNIIQRCIITDPDARFSSEELNYFLTKKDKTTLLFKKHTIESLNTTQYVEKNIELELPNEPLFNGAVPSIEAGKGEIESIKIISSFNEEIEFDAIPSSVTYLDLGDRFDIKANGENLPTHTIKTLVCGFPFNFPINSRSLPQSLTDLQLPNYNAPILKNSIPSTVSYLTLGKNFTHIETLTNLPQSVINLKFNSPSLTDINQVVNLLSNLTKNNPSISSIVVNGNDLKQQDINNKPSDVEMGDY